MSSLSGDTNNLIFERKFALTVHIFQSGRKFLEHSPRDKDSMEQVEIILNFIKVIII